MNVKKEIDKLAKKFRKKEREFSRGAIQAKEADYIASRRYEGYATAFRWCAEDLEELLNR